MKKVNIIYWVLTGLFAAFMLFTSEPDIVKNPEAMTFIGHLGYPAYFVPFIGWAKVLGCIAILVPGYPRLKEWAYAGLFFDLFGAVYSILATDGFNASMLFMILPFTFFALSYIYYHKRLRLQADARKTIR